ncbi:MAG: Kiwa anti-phage protein KwaB-like domain-containing protein [Planctomycetota bacterium]
MKLDFDFENVTMTEFGVGRDEEDKQTFVSLTVGPDVKKALREIVATTWEEMQRDTKDPPRYEPSDKHGSTEYLHLPLNDSLAASIRELHEAVNLPLDAKALANPDTVFCYFVRMKDKEGRRLTALRRSTQFKGVLKSRHRLMRIVTDALQLIEERVFRLDNDFDLLVDAKNVHILRPSGFEFACHLQEAILKAVPLNIAAIEKDLAFVDFAAVQVFASAHPRAARYLASIRGQDEAKNIDKSALKRLCKKTGVEVKESKGKLIVESDRIMDFLEILDRRRYGLDLVKGSPELFRAASRRKLDS